MKPEFHISRVQRPPTNDPSPQELPCHLRGSVPGTEELGILEPLIQRMTLAPVSAILVGAVNQFTVISGELSVVFLWRCEFPLDTGGQVGHINAHPHSIVKSASRTVFVV